VRDALVQAFPLLARGEELAQYVDWAVEDLGKRAAEYIESWSQLPDLEPISGRHVALLLEARELYRL
jgi:hypothetical protein